MRLATSERTLNPAAMSKKGVDNQPAIKGPIDTQSGIARENLLPPGTTIAAGFGTRAFVKKFAPEQQGRSIGDDT